MEASKRLNQALRNWKRDSAYETRARIAYEQALVMLRQAEADLAASETELEEARELAASALPEGKA